MARLVEIELHSDARPLPPRVRDLFDCADDLVERFSNDHRERPVPAFVPSDFVEVHHSLQRIEEARLTTGPRFLEWGSGIGVVTCLASLAGFDAAGIEIEPELVEIARGLADDHGFDVEFVAGSFVPTGGEQVIESHAYNLARSVTWLRTDGHDGYELLGLEADDFDLVFAYPWPGEEEAIFDLFAEYAADGALLLTHHGEDGMLLQRKRR
ncbi:hypothetical protein [Botrimarina sp.]|uniref:hypothetical protein n=1 Tax=Botrimarina sp. TaxID=2795802 RepID=UPI0032EB6DB8